MYRIECECGQQWWRIRAWKHRPWWRILQKTVIKSGKVTEIVTDSDGISAKIGDLEYEKVHIGWAFGPILIIK